MRKLIVAGVLCLAGFVLAPLSSASAFTGTCVIAGSAEFKPALGVKLEPTEFRFHDNHVAVENKCTTGTETPEVEEATVEGKGELSCQAGQNKVKVNGEVKGTGTITVLKKTDTFNFEFVAAGGVVVFTASGGGVNAQGSAEFLSNATAATNCAKGGAAELEFKATAAGEFN
jgi:hypothetical protein